MSKGKCSTCGRTKRIDIELTTKMVDVCTFQFCSFACFQRWFKKNEGNLGYLNDEDLDKIGLLK